MSDHDKTMSPDWFDSRNGHSFGPHGPRRERQCEWCGKAAPSIGEARIDLGRYAGTYGGYTNEPPKT